MKKIIFLLCCFCFVSVSLGQDIVLEPNVYHDETYVDLDGVLLTAYDGNWQNYYVETWKIYRYYLDTVLKDGYRDGDYTYSGGTVLNDDKSSYDLCSKWKWYSNERSHFVHVNPYSNWGGNYWKELWIGMYNTSN